LNANKGHTERVGVGHTSGEQVCRWDRNTSGERACETGISVENGRMEAGISVGGYGIVGERGTRPD
jgi:hypothetical protein